ncbi:uncharacterized protein [Miscanthus floridulus]|uniref:uncharacterized protein n=1 Tax=Miscanthus floridulus TaxID=154761 RepID=UPI00345AD7B2
MDSSQQQKQDGVDVMEVPEIHGDLLMELLDASLAAENAGHQQLGLAADVDDDGDCWIDDSQESYDIHAHQDCEDCGLDGGILPDFDEYRGSRRLRSPAPYVVFDHDDTLEWAETADADDALDPFTSECTGDDWYMDGLVMAMEWEEQDDGGSGGFPFEPCYGGEAGAEQLYASPLWE